MSTTTAQAPLEIRAASRLFGCRPTAEARELLVFLHVPKTGGTTLDRLVLRRAVPSQRTFSVDWRDVPGSWHRFLDEVRQAPARYGYVSGHLTHDELCRLGRPHVAVAFVREPIARTLSHYRYHLSEEFEDHAEFRRQFPALGDFLRDGRGMYENLQARVLAGAGARSAEEAWRIIEDSYDFLGVQELFEISAYHLLEAAGLDGVLPEGRLRSSRAAPGVVAEPTPEEIEIIRERTAIDRCLYETICGRFSQRYVTAGAQRELVRALNRLRAERRSRGEAEAAPQRSADGLELHPGSRPVPQRIGASYLPYRKTYAWAGEFLGPAHAAYSEAVVRGTWPEDGPWLHGAIEGYLRPADALKLYELAFFAEGPIVELGTFRGLATSVLCRAVADSKRDSPVLSIDRSAADLMRARGSLSEAAAGQLTLECTEARVALERMAQAGRKAALVYVDHAHGYDDVAEVCRLLPGAVAPLGFVMFADYNCIWNLRLPLQQHGVHQAVDATLDGEAFEFYGAYGGSAVFRRKPA